MKKYLTTLFLSFAMFSFAQQTPAVKDTIAKGATKTDTTDKKRRIGTQWAVYRKKNRR